MMPEDLRIFWRAVYTSDPISRCEWQLGTVQVDYVLPERFDLTYTGPDNKPHRPVMIHRAPFGSMERFIGVLTEHFAGAFPLWLAPVQVTVLSISEKSADYAIKVMEQLQEAGIRATAAVGPEKIGAKVRSALLEKIPFLATVGEREAVEGSVSVRPYLETVGTINGSMSGEIFKADLQNRIVTRWHPQKIESVAAS